jgi:hypothetical protein
MFFVESFRLNPLLNIPKIQHFATNSTVHSVFYVCFIAFIVSSFLNDDFDNGLAIILTVLLGLLTLSYGILLATIIDRQFLSTLFTTFDFWYLLYNLVVHCIAGLYSNIVFNEDPWVNWSLAFGVYFVVNFIAFMLDAMPLAPLIMRRILIFLLVLNALRLIIYNYFLFDTVYPPYSIGFIVIVNTHDICMSSFLNLTVYTFRFCYQAFFHPERMMLIRIPLIQVKNPLHASSLTQAYITSYQSTKAQFT